MLNLIWSTFFLVSFFAAAYNAFWCGNGAIWTTVANALFETAQSAFHISLNLTGLLCLWLGLLKIAQQSGITSVLAKGLSPLFRKLMPEVPANHPALGSIVMNIAANMLGLDNAATPMGLKAMEQLQTLNPDKKTASNAQILFMVINASAVTIIPINILLYRSQLGSSNPSAVFIPILLATSISTITGLLAVAFVQKLNIFNRVVIGYLGTFTFIILSLGWYFSSLTDETRLQYSENIGNSILLSIVTLIISVGTLKN